MSDNPLWSAVRYDVLRRLEDYAPSVPYEERVLIAEDAARDVKLGVELWSAPARTNRSEEDGNA